MQIGRFLEQLGQEAFSLRLPPIEGNGSGLGPKSETFNEYEVQSSAPIAVWSGRISTNVSFPVSGAGLPEYL